MKACAYVVGPDDGPGAVLKHLARQIGFDAVYFFKDITDVERQSLATPLTFFLFAAVDELHKLKPVTTVVRGSPSQRVRFAPMIYFSETPSLDAIKACINMGFDDIITLPFSLSRVEERLNRQVDRTLVYYETPTYFGPDRRNRMAYEEGHSARGTGGQFRRLEIVRSPSIGVSVVRDDRQVVV